MKQIDKHTDRYVYVRLFVKAEMKQINRQTDIPVCTLEFVRTYVCTCLYTKRTLPFCRQPYKHKRATKRPLISLKGRTSSFLPLLYLEGAAPPPASCTGPASTRRKGLMYYYFPSQQSRLSWRIRSLGRRRRGGGSRIRFWVCLCLAGNEVGYVSWCGRIMMDLQRSFWYVGINSYE